MGSGASKINSSESNVGIEREKSNVTICSEKNNNVIAKPIPVYSERSVSASAVRPLPAQDSKVTSKIYSQNSSFQKQKLPSLQTRKPNDLPSETKVMSLKSTPLEPISKDDKTEKAEVTRLNKELGASESQRLDLQEQVQLLEEKLVSKGQQRIQSGTTNNSESLQETLNAKDQYILKLEREAKTNQADANKLRLKLKKKIKTLTNQLHETRQESSISQMELKAEITRQTEQIKVLKAGGSVSSPSSHDDNQDHSKIIVELSNQLTEQTEQITTLEAELLAKKKEISDLKLAISDHYDSKDSASAAGNSPNSPNPHNSVLPQTSTDRLHSSRGRRVSNRGERSSHDDQKTHSRPDSFDSSRTPTPTALLGNDRRLKDGSSPLLHRQSTALSDSDSDWGDNSSIPSHTHSAPARSRVKSALSLASSGKHKGSMVTLNGNDDSIMDMVSTSPLLDSNTSEQGNRETTSKGKNKSTLKSRLEKARLESQTNSLIGPSLAFERKTDAFSDTSCEPTPRHQRTLLHTDPKARIVKPIVH